MSIAERSQTHNDSLKRQDQESQSNTDPMDRPAQETADGVLSFFEDLVKGVALVNPVTQIPAVVTLFVFNPFTARRISGAVEAAAFQNVEKEVRFTVFDQSAIGSAPVEGASVTFVLGLTQGAGLTDIKGGVANQSSVTVKTGKDGQAIAYLSGGVAEKVVLTGQTSNTFATIEAKTTVDIK